MTVTFQNSPTVKEFYRDRVLRHAALDEIIQGTYWHNGKGCAVGCITHASDMPHQALEIQIGVPVWMGYWIDRIFEELPNRDAKEFPLQFIDVLPVGVDVDSVKYTYLDAFLMDPEYGVAQYCRDAGVDDRYPEYIEGVASLLRDSRATNQVSDAEWNQVRRAGYDLMDRAKDAIVAAIRAARYAAEVGQDPATDKTLVASAGACAAFAYWHRDLTSRERKINHYRWQRDIVLRGLRGLEIPQPIEVLTR